MNRSPQESTSDSNGSSKLEEHRNETGELHDRIRELKQTIRRMGVRSNAISKINKVFGLTRARFTCIELLQILASLHFRRGPDLEDSRGLTSRIVRRFLEN